MCNLLPAFGDAVFNGLIQQVLVGWHLSSSQDKRWVSGGILRLILINGCRIERQSKVIQSYIHTPTTCFLIA